MKRRCKHQIKLDCRLCWIDSGKAWPWPKAKTSNRTTANGRGIPLCIHYIDGKRVIGADAPDTVKDWRVCENGHGIVCPCLARCGPSCTDYSKEPPDAEEAETQTAGREEETRAGKEG